MASKRTFLIVGAGPAGSKAAETLRAEDFYDAQDIELVTSATVTAVDPKAATARLDDGKRISYDRLLFATGAAPRRLAVPGADLGGGVLYLRTLADATALHERLAARARLVVFGAGWIGAEVAASARLRGSRAVEAVVLSDGATIDADVVLVGVGITPRTELAETAGLAIANGIVVDEHLRTSTSGRASRASSRRARRGHRGAARRQWSGRPRASRRPRHRPRCGRQPRRIVIHAAAPAVGLRLCPPGGDLVRQGPGQGSSGG